MARAKVIDRDNLYDLYVVRDYNMKQVAKHLGMCETTVFKYINKYGIKKKITIKNRKHRKGVHLIVENALKNGDKFGSLKPIRWLDKRVTGKSSWECRCDCGKIIVVITSKLVNNQRSCGCMNNMVGENHHTWKGCGEIYGFYFSKLRWGAIKRNLEFKISIDYLWSLFLKQNRKCALSGLPISFAVSTNKSLQTASLDRIDNSKGYIEGNVQWVHKDINNMKKGMTEELLIHYSKAIHSYQSSKKII